MNRYLVTGGLGVIGSRFVDEVMAHGAIVTIVDSCEELRNVWTATRLLHQYGSKIQIIKERIETMSNMDWIQLIQSHDYILHAAAHTGIPHSSLDPTDDWVSNVESTRKILDIMRQSKIYTPTVMLSSVKPYVTDSIDCYLDGIRYKWPESFHGVHEGYRLEPDEPYAASKMAQSALAMAYARSYGLPVTVLRCSNLYGDAPCHGPRHGWLTWFCISAALDWTIDIQGTGYQTRDMLFCSDVASAVFASFARMDAVFGRVFNIGGGSPNTISVLEAYNMLSSIAGHSLSKKSSPGRLNEDKLFVTDHREFSSITGWQPAIDVKSGMERIYSWALHNADNLRQIYQKYSPESCI